MQGFNPYTMSGILGIAQQDPNAAIGGLGKVPGMGQVPEANVAGMAAMLSGNKGQIPSIAAAEEENKKKPPATAVEKTAEAGKAPAAAPGRDMAPLSSAANTMIAGLMQPRQQAQPTVSAPSAGVAPRGQQIQLKDDRKSPEPIDPRIRLAMAQMMFGGK